MSYKRHHAWWGYIKAIIRKYRTLRNEDGLKGVEQREADAVRRAIEKTLERADGAERIAFIDSVFWQGRLTLEGAAYEHSVSNSTAWRWHGDFIKLVAVEMGLADPEQEKEKPEEDKGQPPA